MKQYVIIGCGRFGSSVAKTLHALGNQVLAVDIDEEKVQSMSEFVTYAVQADATDENALKALGVRNLDVAVISIGEDVQSSIMATLIAKEFGIQYILCKAQSELQAKVLYKIGADRVIFPERDMGVRIAHNLVSENILDHIELDPEVSIVEILAPVDWNGKSIKKLDLRAKFGINVLAIKRESEIQVSPMPDDLIKKEDILVVIGKNTQINKIERINV